MAEPANSDGNCLPQHHDDTRGGFQRLENYDACDEEGSEAEEEEESYEDDEEDMGFSLNELMYSAHSFHVISLPGMCLNGLMTGGFIVTSFVIVPRILYFLVQCL